ncbi:ser thr protein phosphatase [Moniliophthora roreri MCA 2997]|uniref:Ser thr protein phosphatase n=1 Tax=Moniliophthora roreri (strain MCA 2997) TaxID=1381753 RepID=V2X6R0_MONRO|nr:ser thr protein phosphatase [Moniliophthora roreri MCA 2997]
MLNRVRALLPWRTTRRLHTSTMNLPNEPLKSPKAIVQVDYTDISQILPKPSEEWTRFVCVSDTHSHDDFEVPPGDVLLHGGDLTNMGTVKDFKKTMDWLYGLPHKKKIIIAGNHDLTLHTGWYDDNWERWHSRDDDINPIIEMLTGPAAQAAGIIYLQDEETSFQVKEGGKTWSIYGSPWSPWFYDWAFNYQREDGQELISKFPKTDILLTHGPPYRIFDRTTGGEDVGCEDLTARLPSLRPRIHLFGHIHEAHGAYIHTWRGEDADKCPEIQNDETIDPTMTDDGDVEAERTVFVNAANWPMGQRMRQFGTECYGGAGFGPVVVDLLD